MKICFVVLCLSMAYAKTTTVDCVNNEPCINRQLTMIIEKFDQEESIPLFGGLEIVKTVENEPDNLDNKPENGLLDRIRRFVATHEISMNSQVASTSRSIDVTEARTKRLKKLIFPLLLALKLKLALVLPAILSAITLVAIKGVFAGLFAILLSGITALKSLTDQKSGQITAILATPLHGISPSHYGYKWGRQDEIIQDPSSLISPEAASLPYVGYQNLPQNIAHH